MDIDTGSLTQVIYAPLLISVSNSLNIRNAAMRNIYMPLLQMVASISIAIGNTANATFPSLQLVTNTLTINSGNVYDFPVLSNIRGGISCSKLVQNFPALVNIGTDTPIFSLTGTSSSIIGFPVLRTIQSALITIQSINIFSAPALESAYGMTFESLVSTVSVPMLQNVTGALTISYVGTTFVGNFLSLQRVISLIFASQPVAYTMLTPSLIEILDSVNLPRAWQAPLLLRIGGSATVSSSLDAPLLATVGGVLSFSTSIALNLPSLVRVYQTNLQNMQSINLPSLTTVTNTLILGANTLNTTLPELTSVGGAFTATVTSPFGIVDLPKLTRVFSLSLTINISPGNILVPLLQDAGVVSITITGGTFPTLGLKNVQRLTIACSICTGIPLPQLAVVVNFISITGSLSLVTIVLGSLTSVGGDVTISACSGTSIATTMLEALVAIPDYGQHRTVSITCTSQTCDGTVPSCLAAKNTLIARGAIVIAP